MPLARECSILQYCHSEFLFPRQGNVQLRSPCIQLDILRNRSEPFSFHKQAVFAGRHSLGELELSIRSSGGKRQVIVESHFLAASFEQVKYRLFDWAALPPRRYKAANHQA